MPASALDSAAAGTCALGATLGTRGRRPGLPIKALKGRKSNRCILRTVHGCLLTTPALCSPLRLPKGEHIRVTQSAPLLRGRGAVTAPALSDSAFTGAAGAWTSVTCRGARSPVDALRWLRAPVF